MDLSRALSGALLAALLLAGCAPAASGPAGATPRPATAPATLAGASATLPAASASPTAAAGAAAPPPRTVRMAGQATTLSDAGIYLAEARGYFREQGIQVERLPMQSGPEALPPLATGQIEISGFAPNAALLNALGRGIAVKLVADKAREGPGFAFQSLVMRRELVDGGPVRTLADLRGRRISLPSLGSQLEASLAAGLAPYGLTPADLQIDLLAFPDTVSAITNGSIDGGVLIEPVTTTALARGAGVLWKPVWELYPQQQVAVIMYGPNLTERDPDLARRWMLAYVKGLRLYNDAYYRNDPAVRPAVTEVLASYTRVAPELVEEVAAAGRLPGLEPDGRVNAEALRAANAYWRQTGTLTADVNVDQLLDSQYVEYVVQTLGPYH